MFLNRDLGGFGIIHPSTLTTWQQVFWWKGHASPPKQMSFWYNLVEATVRHWVTRYGLEEVRTWYFECWNEVSKLCLVVCHFHTFVSPGTVVRRRLTAGLGSAQIAKSSSILQRHQVAVLRALRCHC